MNGHRVLQSCSRGKLPGVAGALEIVLLGSVAGRVASERGRERSYRDGRRNLVVFQDLFRRDALAVDVAHVVLVRLDDHTFELEPGKQTPATRVGEDLRVERQVGFRSGLPADR